MKRLTFFILTLCSLSVMAQDYVVYAVSGKVSFLLNGKQTDIQKAQSLTEQSIISIAEGGQLILLNKSERKLCTIKTAGKGDVVSLLTMRGNKSQNLTDSYFSYIIEKIKSGDEGNQKNYMQSAGTSYRDADSTLLEGLFLEE